jgi:alpha-beta hydrolase superfamily lysophospholipase
MQTQKIKIATKNGDISAVINQPKKQSDKLAIFCAGFLDSKDYKHLTGLAQTLAERGYVVVRFDSIGVWESEGDISQYTMTQYLKDIESVLEYMLSKHEYKNILLGGHSCGGQMSILFAARDPRISVVLGIMPSSGAITGERREAWKKTGVSISNRDLPDDKNKTREFRVPFKHVLERDQYDAVRDIKKIKCPIILIAGELDKLVDPKSVREFFDNASQPKSFTIMPGMGHDYRFNEKEIELVNEKVLEQLDSINV